MLGPDLVLSVPGYGDFNVSEMVTNIAGGSGSSHISLSWTLPSTKEPKGKDGAMIVTETGGVREITVTRRYQRGREIFEILSNNQINIEPDKRLQALDSAKLKQTSASWIEVERRRDGELVFVQPDGLRNLPDTPLVTTNEIEPWYVVRRYTLNGETVVMDFVFKSTTTGGTAKEREVVTTDLFFQDDASWLQPHTAVIGHPMNLSAVQSKTHSGVYIVVEKRFYDARSTRGFPLCAGFEARTFKVTNGTWDPVAKWFTRGANVQLVPMVAGHAWTYMGFDPVESLHVRSIKQFGRTLQLGGEQQQVIPPIMGEPGDPTALWPSLGRFFDRESHEQAVTTTTQVSVPATAVPADANLVANAETPPPDGLNPSGVSQDTSDPTAANSDVAVVSENAGTTVLAGAPEVPA